MQRLHLKAQKTIPKHVHVILNIRVKMYSRRNSKIPVMFICVRSSLVLIFRIMLPGNLLPAMILFFQIPLVFHAHEAYPFMQT